MQNNGDERFWCREKPRGDLHVNHNISCQPLRDNESDGCIDLDHDEALFASLSGTTDDG